MQTDISALNVHALTVARDVMKRYPATGAALLDLPDPQAQLLATLTAADLGRLSRIKSLLFVPRSHPEWWSRVFLALREEGHPEEIDALLDHYSLLFTDPGVAR